MPEILIIDQGNLIKGYKLIILKKSFKENLIHIFFLSY